MLEESYFVNEQGKVEVEKSLSSSKTFAKVFLYFGLALLITGVVSILTATLLFNLMLNDSNAYFITSTTLTIVGVISMVICSLLIGVFAYKEGNKVLIPYIIYSISIGILLSGLAFFVSNPYIFGIVFLVTASIFMIMALIGYFIGNKVGIIFQIVIGLSIGVIIFSLLNLFLFPWLFTGNVAAFNSYSLIYWIGEFLFLFIFMFYVVIDINRLKSVARSGKVISTNLALFFAASLYTNFVNLFIRLFYLIAIFSNRNNK